MGLATGCLCTTRFLCLRCVGVTRSLYSIYAMCLCVTPAFLSFTALCRITLTFLCFTTLCVITARFWWRTMGRLL